MNSSNEVVKDPSVQADVIAQAEKTVEEILHNAVELYYRLALDLRFIAKNEHKLIEAKRRVDDDSKRLGELREKYADKLLEIEAPINEAEGRDPGFFYGSDPTYFLDFPEWTEKRPSFF